MKQISAHISWLAVHILELGEFVEQESPYCRQLLENVWKKFVSLGAQGRVSVSQESLDMMDSGSQDGDDYVAPEASVTNVLVIGATGRWILESPVWTIPQSIDLQSPLCYQAITQYSGCCPGTAGNLSISRFDRGEGTTYRACRLHGVCGGFDKPYQNTRMCIHECALQAALCLACASLVPCCTGWAGFWCVSCS